MHLLKSLLLVLCYVAFALLVFSFALSNPEDISLSLFPLPWEVTTSLFLYSTGLLLLGILIGRFSAGVQLWSARHDAAQEKRRNSALEQELTAHRMDSGSRHAPAIRH